MIMCGSLFGQKAGLSFNPNPLKKNYKELIQQAQKLYEEGALPEALDRFKQASQLRNKISPRLRYRMAYLYYLLNQEEQVIELLRSKTTLKKLPETQLLLALSYKELDQYFSAESHLQHYLETKNIQHREEAMFELADVYFLQEKLNRSESLLNQLIEDNPQEQYLLALAKTFIWKGEFNRAEKILRENLFKGENLPLYAYLMGEIEVNRGEYEKAIELFHEAKGQQSRHFTHWQTRLLESQVQCHLLLADEWSLSPKSRLNHLMRVREPLFELSSLEKSQHLPYAHFYLTSFNLLGDPVSIQRANQLLKEAEFVDPKQKPKTLYLLAQLALSQKEKEKITKELTAEDIRNPYVLRGWYLRGLHDLQLGKKNRSPEILNRACFAFETVWKHCRDHNQHLALMAIQAQIEAYITENTRKSLKQALVLLDEILSSPQWDSGPYHGELSYLQGLASLSYSHHQDQEIHLLCAKESFYEALNEKDSPTSKYALFALGILHFQCNEWEQAEKWLLKLSHDDPSHPLCAEALYFASKCQEQLQQYPSLLRKLIYETYPDSPFSAEAFLTYYPNEEYIKGNEEALTHLSSLPYFFPKSPWAIEAHYLIGLDYKRDHRSTSGKLLRPKDLVKSTNSFQMAAELYASLKAENLLNEDEDYFFALSCQASIERALANLEIAEEAQGTKRQIYLEYAKDLLHGLIHDLQQPPYSLQADPYLSMLEECEFTLATTYEKMEEDNAAEKILLSMHNRFQESKITRSYYLSRMYYELGMIEKRHRHHRIALDYLKKAEDAAKGKILNSDQRLDIWIQQSFCLMEEGEREKAMGILSNVINQDVASSQRLKAMYLRSEIYEKQGREELAIRQLEALAKQQGEWATKAKDKLKAYEY